ncbi:MAG TPA: E3 binding domain-containing protein, partial [Planctomycetota bacterium]|nr:E3 binding domain-containing protein [Planctomycetota bacterium]
MPSLLTVPYLGTAEEDVLVAAWFVEPGVQFRKGQVLVVLETLKASFEVEAEADGVLVARIAAQGARVPLHAALGLLAAAGEVVGDVDAVVSDLVAAHGDGQVKGTQAASDRATSMDAAKTVPKPTVAQVAAAPAARRRARELGLELASISGTGRGGMITVADVEAAYAGGAAHGAALAAVAVEDAEAGRLDPDFVAQLRRDTAAFAALSSDFKVLLYRRHGAQIGEGVRLGDGAVLVCDVLRLGASVRFGDAVRVEAEVFVAGNVTQLSARCRFRATRIELGENAFFAPDVEVGGGGAMDPEALLRVGSHGFVGEHSHLNPCRPLVIGDEVTISRNASLMTHSFANSMLEGYPNRFAGLTIGNQCQIGIGSTLFPGGTMGDGSILLSNSALVTSLPPGRVFAGSPAQDLKAAREDVDGARRLTLAQLIVRAFAAALRARGRDVILEEDGSN